MKAVSRVFDPPPGHWVGDGFPVRSLFSYNSLSEQISPFLLLDYAGPERFEADDSGRKRGVGQHPHRGFETVTIVYQGEVDHRDSTGAGGHIGPGDVQWMTAASGILHDEFHSESFTRKGGTLEIVQLWVNLPAISKMAAPGYQTLEDKDIPVVPLADEAGCLRVIAGEFLGTSGPAHTFTPLHVWDVQLTGGREAEFQVAAGHTAIIAVLHGKLSVNGKEALEDAQSALLQREGRNFSLRAEGDCACLILSGEPIDEPVVGHGPFVMNTEAEIQRAIEDFNSGKFGSISA